MDERLSGVAAVLVGVSLSAVGAVEYLRPGLASPPFEPFATGLLVVGTGLLLAFAGTVAVSTGLDHLSLRSAAAVGLAALVLAVLQPDALLFGGVFWLALVAAGLVLAGTYRTVSVAREDL